MKTFARKGVQIVALMAMTAAVLAACSSESDQGASGGGGGGGPITAVKGSACGYLVNVGLFGGPQMLRGCGQKPNESPTGASPSVSLPEPGGSPTALTATDPDGAVAQYGPARIFAGRWPCEKPAGNCPESAPPSGPISVSTEGTPEGGTVRSTTDITLMPAPQLTVPCYKPDTTAASCFAPGGYGPAPVEGDEMHVECSASKDQTTGSVTVKNSTLALNTDALGEPKDLEQIPEKPPVNFTRSGVITNVGDVFTVVYNEQIINPDGSLTVNGAHMYLFGPTAVGEAIKGQVTCGVTPSPLSPKDDTAPSCGPLVVEPVSPEDPTPKSPKTELIGVFDVNGLKGIENIKVTNGTVQVGRQDAAAYLRHNPGQTGPLPVTASRTPEAEQANLPLTWSFEAVDNAGNKTTCPAKAGS